MKGLTSTTTTTTTSTTVTIAITSHPHSRSHDLIIFAYLKYSLESLSFISYIFNLSISRTKQTT